MLTDIARELDISQETAYRTVNDQPDNRKLCARRVQKASHTFVRDTHEFDMLRLPTKEASVGHFHRGEGWVNPATSE
jgi:hypothetical protein